MIEAQQRGITISGHIESISDEHSKSVEGSENFQIKPAHCRTSRGNPHNTDTHPRAMSNVQRSIDVCFNKECFESELLHLFRRPLIHGPVPSTCFSQTSKSTKMNRAAIPVVFAAQKSPMARAMTLHRWWDLLKLELLENMQSERVQG